jgi:DNA-binding SARP family transcriptional activator
MIATLHTLERNVTPAACPPVALYALGPFRLVLGGRLARLDSESKAAHLLLCLALAPEHRLLRGQLLERIWPQVDPALANQSLHSLVHYLHKLTRSLLGGASILLYQHGYYQLNIANGVWVDLDQFEEWSEQGKDLLAGRSVAEGIRYCRQALALYQGDLAGSTDLQALLERERLRALFLDLLARLADHHYRREEPREALRYLQRLFAHEPCREDAHRQAMRCYVKLNQRTQALRQYRLCCQALMLEFEMQPEPATVALFEQIRQDPTTL